jgi:hypothetical protein
MITEDYPIEETVKLLTDLIQQQEKTIQSAKDLIDVKSELIDLYQLETEMYIKQNNFMLKVITVLSAVATISFLSLLFSLI